MVRFRDILDEYHVEYRETGHEHCRRGWIQLDCPSCSEGAHHFRLGYNIAWGYFNCWLCGRKRTYDTVMQLCGVNFPTAKRLMTGLSKEVDEQEAVLARRPGGKLVLPSGLGPLLPQHKNYLRKRGFNWRELVKLWDVKGIGVSTGGYSWRVFIPIFLHGKCVSWTARSLDDTHAERYRAASLDAEVFDRRELLYGIDYCRNSLVVCEGPTDVWRIGPGAVCTFGTGYSLGQVERLSQFPIRAVCFDSEHHAQRRARALCDLLSVYPGDTYNVVLDATDPGVAGDDEVRAIRHQFLDTAA